MQEWPYWVSFWVYFENKVEHGKSKSQWISFLCYFLHGRRFWKWKNVALLKGTSYCQKWPFWLSKKSDKLSLNFLAVCLLNFGGESKWFWLAWNSLNCTSRLFSKLVETACWWCWTDWTHHLLHAAQTWNFSQHFNLNKFLKPLNYNS